MSSLSWEGGGGRGGGGAFLAAGQAEFQVHFNFHNKLVELSVSRRSLNVSVRLTAAPRILVVSVCEVARTDESPELTFTSGKMHWEQLLRLTKGKVSVAFVNPFVVIQLLYSTGRKVCRVYALSRMRFGFCCCRLYLSSISHGDARTGEAPVLCVCDVWEDWNMTRLCSDSFSYSWALSVLCAGSVIRLIFWSHSPALMSSRTLTVLCVFSPWGVWGNESHRLTVMKGGGFIICLDWLWLSLIFQAIINKMRSICEKSSIYKDCWWSSSCTVDPSLLLFVYTCFTSEKGHNSGFT